MFSYSVSNFLNRTRNPISLSGVERDVFLSFTVRNYPKNVNSILTAFSFVGDLSICIHIFHSYIFCISGSSRVLHGQGGQSYGLTWKYAWTVNIKPFPSSTPGKFLGTRKLNTEIRITKNFMICESEDL